MRPKKRGRPGIPNCSIDEGIEAVNQEREEEEVRQKIIDEGWSAYESHFANEDCPYPRGQAFRSFWYMGWYQARIKERCRFEELCISWP